MAAAITAAAALLAVSAALSELPSTPRGERYGNSPVAGPEQASRTFGTRFIGRTEPTRPINFSLVLRLRDQAVDRFLERVSDPSSPRFQDFLDRQTFGARFGPGLASLERARAWLAARDMRVREPSPERTELEVRATARQIRTIFHVRLGDFVDSSGHRYRAPLGSAVIPRPIRGAVREVAGLSTRPVFQPAAVPEGGLDPVDLAAAYNIRPLHRTGLLGQGQAVAIMSFDSFHHRDVDEFDRLVGIDGPRVEQIDVNGGTRVGPGSIEVNLDIDTIRAIAPRARILNYEAPNRLDNFADMIEQIVAEGRADIVSLSWGTCDALPYNPPSERRRMVQAFQAAAAQGVTVFVASGDWGAYTCQSFNPADSRPTVDFPSATPYVVSVGGTLLSVREDGSYFEERSWEDVVSRGATGGGLSPRDRRPPWQRGEGVENAFSNGSRQVPDVAGPADPDSGVLIVSGGRRQIGGGTSQAAPFWAGSAVLVRQLLERRGKDGFGYLNPILYDLAASDRGERIFHDVTKGGNLLHNATPGWDYATGLGSPDVYELARAMSRYLSRP